MENYIRFDWAMKRLLRNKANYAVLEGLLTTLLEEKVTIHKLLESESNQEDEFDKYNRVDMLAENSQGELVLIEVQINPEKPDVPLNKNDAFQKVQKRRVQEKR